MGTSQLVVSLDPAHWLVNKVLKDTHCPLNTSGRLTEEFVTVFSGIKASAPQGAQVAQGTAQGDTGEADTPLRTEALEDAERLISAALEAEPRNGAYVDSLGWVYYQQGDYGRALEKLLLSLRLLQKVGEDDPVVREHLGDAYAKLGRTEDALAQWRAAEVLDSGNERLNKKIETAGTYPRF